MINSKRYEGGKKNTNFRWINRKFHFVPNYKLSYSVTLLLAKSTLHENARTHEP